MVNSKPDPDALFLLFVSYGLPCTFQIQIPTLTFNGRQQPGSRRSQSCRLTELRKSPLLLSHPGDGDDDGDGDDGDDGDGDEDEDDDSPLPSPRPGNDHDGS